MYISLAIWLVFVPSNKPLAGNPRNFLLGFPQDQISAEISRGIVWRMPEKSSREISRESPGLIPEKKLCENPEPNPGRNPDKTTGRSQEMIFGRNSMKTSGRTLKILQETIIGEVSRGTLEVIPGKSVWEFPGWNSGRNPTRTSKRNPNKFLRRNIERNTKKSTKIFCQDFSPEIYSFLQDLLPRISLKDSRWISPRVPSEIPTGVEYLPADFARSNSSPGMYHLQSSRYCRFEILLGIFLVGFLRSSSRGSI